MIGFTAVVGATAFASIGEVHWRDAAVVGIPAMAGALAGHMAPAARQLATTRLSLRGVRPRRRRRALSRMTELVLAAVLGFAAGGLSGMFGVGGGLLFVPTLVFVLDLSQLEGQATSLAAMIPVVALGGVAPAPVRERPLAGCDRRRAPVRRRRRCRSRGRDVALGRCPAEAVRFAPRPSCDPARALGPPASIRVGLGRPSPSGPRRSPGRGAWSCRPSSRPSARSFRRRRMIFPERVFGRSSPKSTAAGRAIFPIFCATN